MSIALVTVATAILLGLAAYAQYAIPAHTAGSGRTALTRSLLAAIGVALGFVSAAVFFDDPPLSLLAFLAGFGLVHFPAALILFFKHYRGEGRS